MQFAIPSGQPDTNIDEKTPIKKGGLIIVLLFILTIITAVSFHNFLHLAPVFGMMLGLAYLKFFGFYLKKSGHKEFDKSDAPNVNLMDHDEQLSSTDNKGFDIFDKVAKAEWDTLFFFYGVIMAVGGLGFIGYLGITSEYIYGQLGATTANVLVGVLSAIVDNIPVMFAVLTMNPEMPHYQWLLVTLTAGVGGSLLSIGSAAGVALMGQARGYYTFFSHLKWTPVIALGYAASIWVHLLLNSHMITAP
jgi:Na+/H+ antiporter NhaD/arsenite permease-like protein